MANFLGHVAGGLLKGAGEGIMLDGKMKREEALRRLEMDRQDRRDERNYDQRMGLLKEEDRLRTARDDRNYERDSNTITPIQDTEGNYVTKGGDVSDVRGPLPASKQPETGLSAGEKRVWDTVTKGYEQKDELGNVTGFDRQGAAKHLKALGYDKLADMALSPDSAKEQSIPAAPRDSKSREVGRTYLAPDGRKVEWTGQGWRLVQ